MYYSVLYEENQKGYLLSTFYIRLEALELLKSILDDFSENDYIFSEKIFNLEEKFQFQKTYPILSHERNILSTDEYKILFKIELENSFLYHIETSTEFFDLEELPRIQ